MRLSPSRSSSSSSPDLLACVERGEVVVPAHAWSWPCVAGRRLRLEEPRRRRRRVPTPRPRVEHARPPAGQDRRVRRRSSRGSEAYEQARRGADRAHAALADGRGVAARRAADRADHARRRRRACARSGRTPTRRSRKLTASARTELGYVGRHRQSARGRAHMLTADRLRPTFLILRTERALLDAPADPRVRLAHHLRPRPRDLPVLPGPRPAAPAARELGPGERDRRRLPGRAALAHDARTRCRTATLDALRSTGSPSLGARRSGYLAWEYYFAYGTGSPPWVSGMTQATAIAGARRAATARSATSAGSARPSGRSARSSRPRRAACRVSAPGGSHYLLYSFAPVAPRVQRRPAGRDRPARRRRAAALQRAPAAVPRRRARGAARGRASSTPAPGRCTPRTARSRRSTTTTLIAGFLDGLCERVDAQVLLPREPASCATSASRRGSAWSRLRKVHAPGPHAHGALHALEGLEREGARVGHARR